METTALASTDSSNRIRTLLKNAMLASKRSRTWFRLTRRERSIVTLSLRLKIKLQSLDLLRALVSVLKKMKESGNTLYAWLTRGVALAWAFSDAATSWGNKEAQSWRYDRGYIFFLGKMFLGERRFLP